MIERLFAELTHSSDERHADASATVILDREQATKLRDMLTDWLMRRKID